MELLRREVPATSLVVAVDPGKAFNRVWLTTGERGLIGEPMSVPALRDGVDELERLIAASDVPGAPVVGFEATGALHRAWARRSSGACRGRCGCSRRQRRQRRARSWGRDGSSPMIATAPRWSGWCARVPGAGQCPMIRSRRCSARSAIARSSSMPSASCPAAPARPAQRVVSGPVGACGHGRVLELDSPPGRRCSHAPWRSPAGHLRRARCWLVHRAALFAATATSGRSAGSGCLAPPADAECAPNAWRSVCAAGRPSAPTSPWSRNSSPRCCCATDGQILTIAARASRSIRAAGFSAFYAADRALSHRRTPLLGDRPGSGALPVRDDHTARGGSARRPARAPRRADGHRLGPVPALRRVPSPRRRTARPRHCARSRPASRWPATPAAWPADAAHPTALRRTALRSTLGSADGDGLHSYAARRRNLACRPPARRFSRRTRKPAARRRLISLPTRSGHRATPHADRRKHHDHRPRRPHTPITALDRARES